MSQGCLKLLLPALIALSPLRADALDPLCSGRVSYVSSQLIYFDRGESDGLDDGQSLRIVRFGNEIEEVILTQIGEHRSTATRPANSRAKIGDEFTFVCSSHATVPSRVKTVPVPVDESEALNDWRVALLHYSPLLIRYDGSVSDTDDTRRNRVSGEVSTDYDGRGWFGDDDETRSEQQVSARLSGNDIFLRGLGFDFEGKFLARYDNGEDAYLTDRRAIPMIRTLDIRYDTPGQNFGVIGGRFTPGALSGMLDGGGVRMAAGIFSASLVAGVRPDSDDLGLSGNHQTLGFTAGVDDQVHELHYGVSAAMATDWYDGAAQRSSVALNGRLSGGSAFSTAAGVTVDFPFSGATVDGDDSPVQVSNASAVALIRASERVSVDAVARYYHPILYEMNYPAADVLWIEALSGQSTGRGEVGVTIRGLKKLSLRPFGFVLGDVQNSDVGGFVGGGMTFLNHHIRRRAISLSTTIDYGIGAGQKGDLDFLLDVNSLPFGLQFAWYNMWLREQGSDVSSLTHLLMVTGSKTFFECLEFMASLQGAYDHALVRLTYTNGGWMAGRVGVGWQF